MFAPVIGQMASWVLATSVAGETLGFAVVPGVPGGVLWLVGLVVLVIAAWELAGLRYIANNRVGIVEKLWSVKGSVPEGGIIALDGRGGVSGGGVARRLAFRVLAVAVPHSPDAAGFGAPRQDRLCLRPRRRGAACRARRWAR